ncbi:acyl carrier protein [Sulfurimonas sp.]|uniref:acyl carrier protein n=1 Tax=Sulfurimonas sp. TaxID=2022749 RepID=UPI0025FDB8DC|nr:acyl carrier protein [Sulfurimonas sp.]
MATKEEVYSKIKSVLMDEFEVEEEAISMEANLFTDLELDSLDAIDLMVTLDKELGIEIKTEEMQDLRTIEDVCNFVLSSIPADE